MDLDELDAAFEVLRERTRWRAIVHPDDAEAVRLAVIRAHLVPQVRVQEHRHMPRGQVLLLNATEMLARLGLDIDRLPA
jgi:hypothetical protein